MKKSTSGFTLVELLIVIVVIAILAAISAVAYNGIQNRAHDTAVKADLAVLQKKLMLFTASTDKYMRSNELAAMTDFQANTGSYMVAPETNHNLIYCMSITGTVVEEYALIAYSKSGKKFRVTNSSGLEEYETSWSDQVVACRDAVPSNTHNFRGYAAEDSGGGPWRSWVMGG